MGEVVIPGENKMAHQDKRRGIVCAALELIAENGFHGAPMALIADQAEVSSGTIYNFFENKEVLIAEVHQDIVERIHRVLRKENETGETIRERYLLVCTALLRHFIENPNDLSYLEQYHTSPFGTQCRRDYLLGKKERHHVYRELFEEGISRQVVKVLPLPVLIALTFGPLFHIARDHVLGFVTLDSSLISQVVECCWESIRR
jgi:TetR/AcrR family transcriptional regulator, repressor of fatR-cypB operon